MGMLERFMDWVGRRDRTLAGAGHGPGDTTLEPAVAEFDEELERGADEADEPGPDPDPDAPAV